MVNDCNAVLTNVTGNVGSRASHRQFQSKLSLKVQKSLRYLWETYLHKVTESYSSHKVALACWGYNRNWVWNRIKYRKTYKVATCRTGMANQTPHCWWHTLVKLLNRSTLALAIKTKLQKSYFQELFLHVYMCVKELENISQVSRILTVVFWT